METEELTARSTALKAEQAKAQREARAYETMRRNVEKFLAPPKQEPQRKRTYELE